MAKSQPRNVKVGFRVVMASQPLPGFGFELDFVLFTMKTLIISKLVLSRLVLVLLIVAKSSLV